MSDMYTENLGDFGSRELAMAGQLLVALSIDAPDGFAVSGVRVAMNRSSGYVFLVNEDYDVAMMNGNRLEMFYTSPYEGLEGFADELLEQYDDMHPEDQEWMRDLGLVEVDD